MPNFWIAPDGKTIEVPYGVPHEDALEEFGLVQDEAIRGGWIRATGGTRSGWDLEVWNAEDPKTLDLMEDFLVKNPSSSRHRLASIVMGKIPNRTVYVTITNEDVERFGFKDAVLSEIRKEAIRPEGHPRPELGAHEARKDWSWAYHATLQEFLPSIQKDGLRPSMHEHVQDVSVIFVEQDLDGVLPYLEKNGVVLRFKTPGFGSTDDGEDVIFGGEPPLVGGSVPSENIQVLVDGKWRWLDELDLS